MSGLGGTTAHAMPRVGQALNHPAPHPPTHMLPKPALKPALTPFAPAPAQHHHRDKTPPTQNTRQPNVGVGKGSSRRVLLQALNHRAHSARQCVLTSGPNGEVKLHQVGHAGHDSSGIRFWRLCVRIFVLLQGHKAGLGSQGKPGFTMQAWTRNGKTGLHKARLNYMWMAVILTRPKMSTLSHQPPRQARDHLGLVQGWESECRGMLGLTPEWG